jgi:O-antigen/teichoic acid export membrane protein
MLEIKLPSVKFNIFANFIGRGAAILLSFILVPVFIKLLGVEAYGLVGFSAILVTLSGLLDLGLGATLSREFARLSLNSASEIIKHDTLRTFEIIYWLFAGLIFVAVIIIAPWLAENWLGTYNLSMTSVVTAIRWMGVIVALQFLSALYQGALMGMQRQVLLNTIILLNAIFRGGGAILALWLISASIEIFFLWQALSALFLLGPLIFFVRRSLSAIDRQPQFSYAILKENFQFSSGVFCNSLIGVALTQMDKLLLSSMLPLQQFSYYSLATSGASMIWSISMPITSAVYPKLTQLVALGCEVNTAKYYSMACQLMAALLVPTMVLMVFFSQELLVIWLHDINIAKNLHVVLALLVIGTAINGLVSIPFYLQYANGWTSLLAITNIVLALVMLPLIWGLTSQFGIIGAASAWVILNLIYVIFMIPFMHRRLLKGMMATWYKNDLIKPVFIGALCMCIFKTVAPPLHYFQHNMLEGLILMLLAWVFTVFICLLFLPQLRTRFVYFLKRLL